MRGLGELESAVMDVLWSIDEPVKVRDVLERLNKSRQLAYTTVMTVLDNLYRKEWVQREKDGKAYRYRPALSRAEAHAQALRDVLDTSGDPEAVLLHFARSFSDSEIDLIRKALRRKAAKR
jgi:predicted transcriptional regulator